MLGVNRLQDQCVESPETQEPEVFPKFKLTTSDSLLLATTKNPKAYSFLVRSWKLWEEKYQT